MLLTTGQRISTDQIPYGKVTGDWSDKEVYVIGGGPSLEGFDFSKLDGYTIGANKSAIVANTDAMFSMDWKFAVEAFSDILAYKGEVYFAVMTKHNCIYNPDIVYLKSGREGSLSTDPSMIIGLNSGYGAMNIAFLKGAKKINLLGFDMQLDSKKHFHGGYPWDKSKGASYNAWARRFKFAKTKLDEHNIQVINYVGPKGSGLTVFPTRPLDDLQ